MLRKSSPVLEIDTPRDCPVTTRPVWLKREGLPLSVEQVLEFAKEVPNHYGIFKKQDCYALRVSQADFHKTKFLDKSVRLCFGFWVCHNILLQKMLWNYCTPWLGKQKCSLEVEDFAMEGYSIWFGAVRLLP